MEYLIFFVLSSWIITYQILLMRMLEDNLLKN